MAKKKAKKAKRPAAKAKAKTSRSAKKVSRKPARKPVRKAAPRAAQPKPQPKGLASGYQWVNPFLVVRNMNSAIQFYQNGFGLKLKLTMKDPAGNLVHAELLHNDSTVMLGPENQERGSLAPTGPQGMNLYMYLANVDDVCARAASNGAKVKQPPTDMPWGDRVAIVEDPDGHTWWLSTHLRDVSPEEMSQAAQSQ